MKKIKLLLLLLMLGTVSAFSQIQQIKIVSFTVKNQLPAVIDNWNNVPGALLLVAQLPPTIRVNGIRLIMQIKANGAIVCSNNAAGGLQVDNFTTRTFSVNELTGALQGCHDLKDGSYSICVQFFNIDRVAISNEVCKEFTVETPKETDYSPPTLINPENGKVYTEAALSRPVTFRWTPLVPKPRETVTYRLKVWQLMQGQNGVQAIRSNQPIVTKDVDNITQTVVNGIYTGPCKPPYLCDFIWMVQALNKEGKPMGRNEGNSEPYTFKVSQQTEEINPPVNVYPENKRTISLDEAKRSITFKWKPISPNQPGIKYRLRVWQLMEGQSSAAAIKTNQPYATLDVDGNGQMDALTDGLLMRFLTGPCKPPYLCDFVWNVQALNREGHPVGRNEGTSEPTVFAVSQYIIQLDSIKVSCTGKPGVYAFSYTITNPNPGPATLNVFQVTSSVPAGATISSFAPPIGTVINSGNQLTITGTITGAPNLTNICIGAEIKDVGNAFWKASKDTCANIMPCACDACDKEHFIFNAPPPPITIANNTISFNQAVTVTTSPPKTITTIKAELVYYEMVPENDMCIPCNKEAATYGHFTNGTNSQEWNGPQQNLNISITTPQLTPCCSAVFKWCIRYKIEFKDKDGNCYSCNKLVCYEKKKEGCEKINPDKNQK